MPLSDEEQKILKQIEEQFYEHDPKFAQQVGSTSLYRHGLSRVRLAAAGLVAGMVFLVATLQVHYLLAFVGFLAMLGCAQDLAGVVRERRPRATDGPKLRERFRRD
jgi:Protein of unknown function (DUF3040)